MADPTTAAERLVRGAALADLQELLETALPNEKARERLLRRAIDLLSAERGHDDIAVLCESLRKQWREA
jgi:spore germination protein YaaH